MQSAHITIKESTKLALGITLIGNLIAPMNVTVNEASY